MLLSRRTFMKAASAGGIGVLTAPLIAARGSEALRDGILDARSTSSPDGGVTTFASEQRAAQRLALRHGIRLDSNENPNGPGQVALDAIRAMFGEASRYPDVPADDLRGAIALHQKVAPENILIGCGSGEILRMLVFAFTSPQRALVTAAPSFEDPVKYAEVTGAQVRAVPVDSELRLDLARMLDNTMVAGLVFLCNPNNPTATVHGSSAVKEFIAQSNKRSPDCVVAVDEAYHEYVDDPSYTTAIPLALENPRVVVVRTFSKVFGMAGLRVGYAIGQPETLKALQRHKLPNNLNVFAAAAGAATLPDLVHVEHERHLNREAREFARRTFESMGYHSFPSNTNFIMVDIGRDSKQFKEACAKRGILVGRAFPPLTTRARISIGTMDEMKQAVDVFRQVLSSAAS